MGIIYILRNFASLSHMVEFSQFLQNVTKKRQKDIHNTTMYTTFSMEIRLKISGSSLCLGISCKISGLWYFRGLLLPKDKVVQRNIQVFQRLNITTLEGVVWGVPYRVSALGGTTPPIQAPFLPHRSVPLLTPALFVLPMENTLLSCSYETGTLTFLPHYCG